MIGLNGFDVVSRIIGEEGRLCTFREGSPMRSEQEVNRAIERYADLVFRLCMVNLKNHADAEDVFQTVFLKYTIHNKPFCSPEQEKAWLIRVTLNECRDLLKNFFRKNTVPLEEAASAVLPEHSVVLDAVRSLPKDYRDAVYLHYYEGYTAPEIAAILKKNPNTVYTHLTRGRTMLKEILGGEADE